jgi:hypothetical protein
MSRLSRAGFKTDFVFPAILPDWWDESCSDDPSVLQDIEIRLARFLGVPLEEVKNPNAALAPPTYPEAQLRRVREIDRDRLRPAIHSGIRIAGAAIRNLRNKEQNPMMPPSDALTWRNLVSSPELNVNFDAIISDLWMRGIPVVPLDVLPSPSFQAMSCIAEGRPVILLGHKYDEPGRAAFLIVHEVGHLVAGDCAPGRPVVDEEEEIADNADIERRADQYATRVLINADTVPDIDGESFKELARSASEIEKSTGADASTLIFAWARRTGDYATATMAVRALYRHLGARRKLRELFDLHVDLSSAGETDRALLRCVHGDPEHNEAAG